MSNLETYLATQNAQPAVADVITTITKVGIQISDLLKRGALADILGEAGNQNVQGEEQKKLDVIANDLLLDALSSNPHCAGVASEELDNATPANQHGDVLVLFDPLDGSSNIDINMAVGTIFSILPYHHQGQTATDEDFLQKGTAQLASGYILYGTSTVMSITLGKGVAMFSLDPDTKAFVQIKDQVQISADTKEYAINASNYRYWLPPMQRYIDEFTAGKTGVRGKDFNMRWVAAMVGDIHRI
ncbi:MAG: class 1 fructose-1,6-bisphosphatase, partial [Moraxella osloensis]